MALQTQSERLWLGGDPWNDPWDTQTDRFLALTGAICSRLLFAQTLDRQPPQLRVI
jgi:uncharacterized membrane protein YjdF